MRHPRRRLPFSERLLIAAGQDWKCALCNDVLNECFELDHKRSLGMALPHLNCSTNYHAVCVTCHRRKSLFDVRASNAWRRGDSNFGCPRCGDTVSVFMQHHCRLHRRRCGLPARFVTSPSALPVEKVTGDIVKKNKGTEKPVRLTAKRIEDYFQQVDARREPTHSTDVFDALRYRPPS